MMLTFWVTRIDKIEFHLTMEILNKHGSIFRKGQMEKEINRYIFTHIHNLL